MHQKRFVERVDSGSGRSVEVSPRMKGYVAVMLDPDCAEHIRNLAMHMVVAGDKLVLFYQPPEDVYNDHYQELEGCEVHVPVRGLLGDAYARALVLEQNVWVANPLGGFSEEPTDIPLEPGRVLHVTVSHSSDVRPHHAQHLARRTDLHPEPVEGLLEVRGRLAFVPFAPIQEPDLFRDSWRRSRR